MTTWKTSSGDWQKLALLTASVICTLPQLMRLLAPWHGSTSVDWALLHCVAWHASSWMDCASLVWMELRVHVQWLLNDMPMMLLSYRRMERGGSSAALRVQTVPSAHPVCERLLTEARAQWRHSG